MLIGIQMNYAKWFPVQLNFHRGKVQLNSEILLHILHKNLHITDIEWRIYKKRKKKTNCGKHIQFKNKIFYDIKLRFEKYCKYTYIFLLLKNNLYIFKFYRYIQN